MFPPSIALFLRSPNVRAYIASGLEPSYAVTRCHSFSELLEALERSSVVLVVLEAADEQGVSQASLVAAIRSRCERIAILAVCDLNRGHSQLVVDIVRAGASGLLFRGIDDSRLAIRIAIQTAVRSSVAERIHSELCGAVPAIAAPLLRYALVHAADEPSVSRAAKAMGVNRKTLFNWLQQTGGIGPREFLNWIRLALAVGALEDTDRSAEQVALELGFASGTSFRNMLQRYTGLTTTAIRKRGGLDHVLTTMKARLSKPDSHPDVMLVRSRAESLERRHA